MDEQLAANAKTLARWCYARGIDERILECGENLLRSAVDQALGRAAPLHLECLLWQHPAALLGQRRDWARAHQVSGPAAATCLLCAVELGSAACRARLCQSVSLSVVAVPLKKPKNKTPQN